MKIDQAALEELKRICAESFQRNLSDDEALDVGQRIIRFLTNSPGVFPAQGADIDAD